MDRNERKFLKTVYCWGDTLLNTVDFHEKNHVFFLAVHTEFLSLFKEVLHRAAEVGGNSAEFPPTYGFSIFSLTRIFEMDLNSRNETLDQRGHFVLLESKMHRVVEEKSLLEIKNDEMTCTNKWNSPQ